DLGEWESEWVRDTKRSQTQCVSPRGPPPLAGHTLPVDQKDRGREGESGRGGKGHKREAIRSVCLHGEKRGGPRPPQKCIKIGQNEVRQPHGAQVFFRSEPKSTFFGLSRFRAVTPRETLFMHSSRIRGLLRMCPRKAHLRRTEFWGWTSNFSEVGHLPPFY